MGMSLLQISSASGVPAVAAFVDAAPARLVQGIDSVRTLALRAAADGLSLGVAVQRAGFGAPVDLGAVTLRSPIDHADPAHLIVSGTGLTHLGSAEGRDKMHR